MIADIEARGTYRDFENLNNSSLGRYYAIMTNENNSPDQQPDELNDLGKTAREYVERKERIEHEIETLKEDLKALKEEFEEKIDMKELERVLKVLKIRSQVKHKDTFDALEEALTTDTYSQDEG